MLSGSQISGLRALVGFVGGLTNADADGRIILDTAACRLKFVLLNAAAHFSKVLPPMLTSCRWCWLHVSQSFSL